jgi:branched-subunit amino acid ABC-type transport system permease component
MDFTASLSLTFIGFAAAIIFGIQSPVRSLLGGLAMGVVEALSSGYTSGMVTAMVPSLFMLIVLMSGQLGASRFSGDRP